MPRLWYRFLQVEKVLPVWHTKGKLDKFVVAPYLVVFTMLYLSYQKEPEEPSNFIKNCSNVPQCFSFLMYCQPLPVGGRRRLLGKPFQIDNFHHEGNGIEMAAFS